MTSEPLGDSALILRELPYPAYQVAEAIQAAALTGVHEAIASYDTVGVYFDPAQFDPSTLFGLQFGVVASAAQFHHVPVCYETRAKKTSKT